MDEEKSRYEIYFVSSWQQVIDIVGQSSGVEVPMEWLEILVKERSDFYRVRNDSGYEAAVEFWPVARNYSHSLDGIAVVNVSWHTRLTDEESVDSGNMTFAFSDRVKALLVSDSTIIREM